LALSTREKLQPETPQVGGLEGQAKRLHSFWPRGREFDSRHAHFEKTLIFITFL
jgi:hypothetical protein